METKGSSDNLENLNGAKNLLKAFNLKENDGLIVINTENKQNFSQYLFKAAKELDLSNIIQIQIPEVIRPLKKVPELINKTIPYAKGIIHVFNRRFDEEFKFVRPIQQLCEEKKVKYLSIYDAKIKYLREGIAANYSTVSEKGKIIKDVLENSKEIEITSDIGTNLRFSIYTDKIFARTPIFVESERYVNQAPEGETMSCPIESTFNGRMVIDGTVTGLGEVPEPIIWDFKDGKVVNVEGNNAFLLKLLKLLQSSDRRLKSLIGVWIAELSIGSNDWAVYDDNISNCEKVAGGIHLAMGKTAGGIGENRGETYHFDNIIKNSTLIVTKKNGEKFRLIDSGKLMV